MDFYNKEIKDVLLELDTKMEGLTGVEAGERLLKYGRNELSEGKKKNIFQKTWDQVNDPMILVLIGAAVVSGFMGESVDAAIILIVVVLNTVIGLIQEIKAEAAVEALKKMSAQSAKVIRDGKVSYIDSTLLVPGDLVVLDAGDVVPSDLRLIESSNLKIEEASLTGESVPSEKDSNRTIAGDAQVGDRVNMAYYGTGVTYGRGRGLVCSTGMNTEMGKIANLINQTEEDETPLQKKLAEIGKILTIGVLGICLVIFATIIWKGGSFDAQHILDAFMVSVSLAVAAIPESLPAVVTIVMAIGVTVMAKKKAIIRKLPAVETLGCAEVICSDKTGTLTQNKMSIREIYTDHKQYSDEAFLKTEGYEPLYYNMVLCNDSEIDEEGNEVGDPTETCLKRFSFLKYNQEMFRDKKRIRDLPFDSERKMMSTVNQIQDKTKVYTKGAPDEILKRCTAILENGQVHSITEEQKNQILSANKEMADKALRVLGLAEKEYVADSELEQELTFIGLVGMIDPPRPEAKEAIEKCKHAGIRTVMITGDHRDTAVAIASELGMIEDAGEAVFGSEMDAWPDEELMEKVDHIKVFARVSPEHKVRIVEAWKKKGKIIAMTGDGVNDAPALKIADIGVGMGITGTDVSKSVSDMLLQDDNFATIVSAVEEGRKIYTNIRKSVHFLLSSNLSEVLSLFFATLFLPAGVIFLSPVHILWINLVTDSIPAIGLGLNKGEEGVMNEPPRDAKQSIFAGGVGVSILYQGVTLMILTCAAFMIGYQDSPLAATTMAFVTLSIAQIFHSFNIKNGNGTIFSKKTLDNKTMLIGLVVPILLAILIVHCAPLANLFNVQALTLYEWGTAIGLAFCINIVDEIVKIFKRRNKR